MRKSYRAVKGTVILPEKILKNAVVTFDNEKITGIFEGPMDIPEKDILDVKDSYILPGCIDAHVHCYSSIEEGFINAGNSAAAGGITTIIEMPYDASGMICTSALFLEKKARLEREAVVDTALLATIKPKDGIEHIKDLVKNGACGFKISMFNTNSARFPRIDDGEMLDIFYEIEKTNLPVGIHAENNEIVNQYIDKHKKLGIEQAKAHCLSRPKAAESAAVLSALELAYWTGVKLHIYHSSFPRIFELIDYYRNQGVKVTAETCPHYLLLNEEDMSELKGKAKINPPLRSKKDTEGLWEKIQDNSVDIITSDHAPWKLESKLDKDIFKNASGAPGVETLIPIVFSEGVSAGKISILQMVKILCEEPAKIFGLAHKKGKIDVGMDADFTIINPNEKYILNEAKLHSSAGWSPYNNLELKGKVTHTILRGNLIYNDEILVKPSYGKFVSAIHK